LTHLANFRPGLLAEPAPLDRESNPARLRFHNLRSANDDDAHPEVPATIDGVVRTGQVSSLTQKPHLGPRENDGQTHPRLRGCRPNFGIVSRYDGESAQPTMVSRGSQITGRAASVGLSWVGRLLIPIRQTSISLLCIVRTDILSRPCYQTFPVESFWSPSRALPGTRNSAPTRRSRCLSC